MAYVCLPPCPQLIRDAATLTSNGFCGKMWGIKTSDIDNMEVKKSCCGVSINITKTDSAFEEEKKAASCKCCISKKYVAMRVRGVVRVLEYV